MDGRLRALAPLCLDLVQRLLQAPAHTISQVSLIDQRGGLTEPGRPPITCSTPLQVVLINCRTLQVCMTKTGTFPTASPLVLSLTSSFLQCPVQGPFPMLDGLLITSFCLIGDWLLFAAVAALYVC